MEEASIGRKHHRTYVVNMSAEDIIPIYKRHVDAYDRLRTRALFERPWLDRFHAALPAGRHVLDLGCGMGEPMAAYLIQKGCAVIGVDTSEGMLDLARRRFPSHRWICHDMRNVSLDVSFDGILAWDSFFLLTPDDQRSMFGVFQRHILPGGALMFTSGPSESQRYGSFAGECLYHSSLSPEEYRALLARQGFDVLDHRPNDPECDYHTVWLAQAR